MTLGVTDTLKPTIMSYVDWIRRIVDDVEIVLLSHVNGNLDDLRRCEGLVLTGGGDVHPKYYGREDAFRLVHGVDELRDEFEFELVRRAVSIRLPTLGICRGLQVYNVALGGTMIPDLQLAGFEDHRNQGNDLADPLHQIRVQEASLLHSVTGRLTGEVNTRHHQGVAKCAEQLRSVAQSLDGVIEGVEWKEPQLNPFLLLVQWHPERMADFDSPFSKGILRKFIAQAVSLKEVHFRNTIITSKEAI